MKILKALFNIFASYALACVLFVFLLLLVFLGTLDQVDNGLYHATQRYFDSMFVIHYAFDTIPVPLPGVYLLLVILAANVICGGLIRIKKDRRRGGILIIHLGILVLLFGGFIQRVLATDGHITLYPEEQSSVYESYFLSEIGIAEANLGGATTEFLIPDSAITSMGASDTRTFTNADLPFDIELSHYMANCTPAPASAAASDAPTVDGIALQSLPRVQQAEQNLSGVYATIKPKDGSPEQTGILLCRSRWSGLEPWAFTLGDKTWVVDLRKKTYPAPFTLRLDKFNMELHPGTSMAANYESEVTRIEDGEETAVNIRMNEPLRYHGYTVFQTSWGPEGGKPGDRLFSSFAVVKNPADQWPLYACIIIAIGLAIHFLMKLSGYVRAETRRAAQ